MSNRTLLILTVIVIIGMGVILALNVMPVFFQDAPPKYLTPGEIQGSAAQAGNAFYTLNFEQQNALIDAINASSKVETAQEGRKDTSFAIEKIDLYFFTGKTLSLKLSTTTDNELLFSADEPPMEGIFKENTKGALKKLLNQAIDSPNP